jgi:hypothetical protein
MHFIGQYKQLRDLFNLDSATIKIPESNLEIKNFDFISDAPFSKITEGADDYDDFLENIRFRYPVILPAGKKKADKAIIYLHGLNERTWHKHLTGATYLAQKSGKAVILFPLSFHINRGLPDWTDTRKMCIALEKRKGKYTGLRDATVVNLALSERLTEHPGRFFIAGIQSSMDLTTLIKQIGDGEHPLFEQGTTTDLFAYSIGCTLVQSLLISNPGNILSKSNIVLFAGGSLFGYIQAVSRYIMDSVAFETVRKFYLNAFRLKKDPISEINPVLMEHSYGRAFRSMLTQEGYKAKRENAMKEFSDHLMVIALQKDRVMPVEGTRMATGEKFYRSGRFRILDFSYEYSHENPFPVLYKKIEDQVEKAFLQVFEPAAQFLGEN